MKSESDVRKVVYSMVWQHLGRYAFSKLITMLILTWHDEGMHCVKNAVWFLCVFEIHNVILLKFAEYVIALC